MKCIVNWKDEVVERVPDRLAKMRTDAGTWHYSSKGRWKAAGRPGKDKTYHKAELRALDGWT